MNKKEVLCETCRNVDWQTVHTTGARIVDVCYYPANQRKFGHAVECAEYEPKPQGGAE